MIAALNLLPVPLSRPVPVLLVIALFVGAAHVAVGLVVDLITLPRCGRCALTTDLPHVVDSRLPVVVGRQLDVAIVRQVSSGCLGIVDPDCCLSPDYPLIVTGWPGAIWCLLFVTEQCYPPEFLPVGDLC